LAHYYFSPAKQRIKSIVDVPTHGYTGACQDPVSFGYPLGHGYRWYLPSLMRFNAPDDWSPFAEGGVNPYAYCEGDPINRSDPSGHWWGAEIAEEAEALRRIKSAPDLSVSEDRPIEVQRAQEAPPDLRRHPEWNRNREFRVDSSQSDQPGISHAQPEQRGARQSFELKQEDYMMLLHTTMAHSQTDALSTQMRELLRQDPRPPVSAETLDNFAQVLNNVGIHMLDAQTYMMSLSRADFSRYQNFLSEANEPLRTLHNRYNTALEQLTSLRSN
jgi:RHS repeat-associated protein